MCTRTDVTTQFLSIPFPRSLLTSCNAPPTQTFKRSSATGTFPASISAFTNLLVISCFSNSITGQFPWSSLTSLPSLVSLSLGDNFILPTPPNSVGGYVLPSGSTFLPCPAGWYGPDRGRGSCNKCPVKAGGEGACFIGQVDCDGARYPCGTYADGDEGGKGGRVGREER